MWTIGDGIWTTTLRLSASGLLYQGFRLVLRLERRQINCGSSSLKTTNGPAGAFRLYLPAMVLIPFFEGLLSCELKCDVDSVCLLNTIQGPLYQLDHLSTLPDL